MNSLFATMPPTFDSPRESFLSDLIENILASGYKTYNGAVMQQLKTSTDDETCHWKPISSIEHFVCEYFEYNNRRRNNTHANICFKYLKQKNHPLALEIGDKYKQTFSFNNGIYFAWIDKFVKYGEEMEKYKQQTDSQIVSCNYFDTVFDESITEKDWREIDTKEFDSIFLFQNLNSETIEWIYVFCGRLLYRLNERDNWGVALIFDGVGGSGKNTIQSVLSSIYRKSEINIIHSSQFEHIYMYPIDPCILLNLCCGNIDLPSDRLLEFSIVGGRGSLSKEEHSDAPIMFFGGISNYSIADRLLVCNFNKMIEPQNRTTDYFESIETMGIDKLIRKMNCAYLEYSSIHDKTDIWSCVPNYFKEQRIKQKCKTNSLFAYIHELRKYKLEVPPNNDYIPLKTFMKQYKIFCKESGLQFIHDIHLQQRVFEECGLLTVCVINPREYNGTIIIGGFIFGIFSVASPKI